MGIKRAPHAGSSPWDEADASESGVGSGSLATVESNSRVTALLPVQDRSFEAFNPFGPAQAMAHARWFAERPPAHLPRLARRGGWKVHRRRRDSTTPCTARFRTTER